MKFFLACALLVASSLAEPPVDNRYLPPQARNPPTSQTYGVPGFGQRQTDAVFRGRPSSTYGTPTRSRRPNTQYGPPQATTNQYQGRNQAPNSQYLPPTSQYQAPTNLRSTPSQYQAPNSQYLPPTGQYQTSTTQRLAQTQHQAPTSQYLPPSGQYQASSQQRSAQGQHQAPTAQYLPPTSQYQAPSTQYGLPDQARSNAPSQEYGAPGFARSGSDSGYDNQQSRQYLPPKARSYDDGSNGEPANYEFEYMVQDAASGNDFGHREERRGDRAEGRYYVLLPDGRTQTVEYEADQDGFKPRISYEDNDSGAGYSDRQTTYNNDNTDGPYFFLACALLVASSLAEPPVDNRYLPPQARNTPPSQTYGVPGFGQRQTDAVFRGRPSSTYGTPTRSRRPNTQYGPPQATTNQYQGRNQAPNSQYLPPTSQYQAPMNLRSTPNQYQAPNSQYLPPTGQYQTSTTQRLAQTQHQAPTSQYLPPSGQYQASSNQRSAQGQHQAPTAQYLPPTSQYQAPSTQYGLPDQARSNAPSQEYGAPGFARSGSDSGYDNQQSRQYLPPNARSYDDGSNGEPANYEFEYMVQDAASGNDFGHREERRGDRAEGRYYVLLPDGRTQTVEYEADQDGFKPRISYEDNDSGAGYSDRQTTYNNDNTNGPY